MSFSAELLTRNYDRTTTLTSLVELHSRLALTDDGDAVLRELNTLVAFLSTIDLPARKEEDNTESPEAMQLRNEEKQSLSIYKVLSACYILCLRGLPRAKTFDSANTLVGDYLVPAAEAKKPKNATSRINANPTLVLLIDLYAAFPAQVSNLNNAVVSALYRLWKHDPDMANNQKVVFLLATAVGNANALDIPDKLLAKLVKYTKVQLADTANSTPMLRDVLRVAGHLATFQMHGHYTGLIARLAKGKKAASLEEVHTQQAAHQAAVLATYLPCFVAGMVHREKDIRTTAVGVLATVMFELVPTDASRDARAGTRSFAWEYIVDLYITGSAHPRLRTSAVELFIQHTQLAIIQDPQYLSANTVPVLIELLFRKVIVPLANWKVFQHWRAAVRFLLSNNANDCGEITLAGGLNQLVRTYFGTDLLDADPETPAEPSAPQCLLLLDVIAVYLEKLGASAVVSTCKFVALLDRLILDASAAVRAKALLVLVQYNAIEGYNGVNLLCQGFFAKVKESGDSAPYAALALATIVRMTPVRYLRRELLLQIMSYCTLSLKQKAGAQLVRACCCWTVLAGLMIVPNSDLVQLNTSQFLIFWKGLLTHNFNPHSLVGESDTPQDVQRAVATNMALRNHGLVALLAFVSHVAASPEVLRQVGFILAKALTYVNSVEASFQEPLITATLLEDPSDPRKLALYHKKLLVQCYLLIAGHVERHEMNSNLMIFAVKNFAATSYFNAPEIDVKPKAKPQPSHEVLLLETTDGLCHGLSSKYAGESGLAWYAELELLAVQPVPCDTANDPMCFVLAATPPPLVTELVDLSIGLFQVSFPSMSLKIQLLLVETLRAFLFQNEASPRLEVVHLNTALAIHGLAKGMRAGTRVDTEVAHFLMETVKNLQMLQPDTVRCNAETLALLVAGAAGNAADVTQHIATITNDIVSHADPLVRSRNVLALACIYQHTAVGFVDIYAVVAQLAVDTHPVLNHWALRALVVLLESHHDNLSLCTPVLELMVRILTDDRYGYDMESISYSNMRVAHPSVTVVARVVKVLVSSLGPGVRTLGGARTMLRDVLTALSLGIGAGATDDYEAVSADILLLLQELVLYDPLLLYGQLAFFVSLIDFQILKNLKVTTNAAMVTSSAMDIFVGVSSPTLFRLAIACYTELVKIHGCAVISESMRDVLWIAMDLQPCVELTALIKLWVESDKDNLGWFTKLVALYGIPRVKLLHGFNEKLLKKLNASTNAHSSGGDASTKIDLGDEEVEGIVGEEADDSVSNNEPVGWAMRVTLVEIIRDLLAHSRANAGLLHVFSLRIQDLVRVSFVSSSSNILPLQLAGIQLLGMVLEVFGNTVDPLYPSTSILEQQQAQIISAIIPCFGTGSSIDLVIRGVEISSKFLNLPRIRFSAKQRVLKSMVTLLDEFSSKEYVLFPQLKTVSELQKKAVKLTLLDCWALMKLAADDENDESEEEDIALVLDAHMGVLVPMWILSLREYSIAKYSDAGTAVEVEIYQNYWIDFIDVLSSIFQQDQAVLLQLLGSDVTSFFFAVFSGCIESCIRNKNTERVLKCLGNLCHNNSAVGFVFDDEVFVEVVDLFDRLVLVGSPREKMLLTNLVYSIFDNYVRDHTPETGELEMNENIDKLFELLRVDMLLIVSLLPFLREEARTETKAVSATELALLRNSFQILVAMIAKFPSVVKVDLYSCLLYVFAVVYEHNNPEVISLVLPHLKQVIADVSTLEVDLVTPFYEVVRPKLSFNDDSSLLSYIIILTNSDVLVAEQDMAEVVHFLMQNLTSPEPAPLGVQSAKTLLQFSAKKRGSGPLAAQLLVPALVRLMKTSTEPYHRLVVELMVVFAKSLADSKNSYAVVIPVVLHCAVHDTLHRYIKEQLLELVTHSPEAFKFVISSILPASQRQMAEALLKATGASENGTSVPDQDSRGHIQLKSFGS
ncbi:hypothetical protein BABINDRAFT_166729 [Babjeviella inositovora NRRL Y-12698]|uniref:LAA1-like C-terminal TPR repeats domain-containing protein n=1 Tax=Babjeviella inositovora NRRL Y-12698 TaxID=984486 RepID=A0A1E3QTP8_9ASCO|nr:uncharacterized protein BABINDRAFT_166729 [Babjeviella inositovora NRRL Y-12698]ODQ80392.1 hypothetical protein BABINDRAFT_166729 [Babjeviella inositovora NRRL Y-12698]